MAPNFAAEKLRREAFDDLGLRERGMVWEVVEKLAKKRKITITTPNLKFTFPTSGLKTKPDSWLDTSDRPRTLPDARRDDVWDMFERRLRALLPWVRQQLDVRHFALGRTEWRATRSDRHGTFVPRMTAGEKEPAPGPRIFGVYFLRAGASPHGGELRLYDTWQTESSRVDAASYTSLRPIDNSIVFWLRGESHEFFPEPTHQADANIAITFTFWEDTATDRVDDSQVCASADVETPLGRGANVPVAPSFMESARSPAPAPARRSNGRRPGRQLVAVVVPAHCALSQDDRIALRHLRTHLGEFDRYVVGATVPAGEFSDFLRPSAPACAFADRMSYNRMLASESFYRVFARYEHILIYQLDSLVFSNQLEDWCRKDYDYVGAPWFERWHRARSARNESIDDVIDGFGTVGNGGFSLRKVDAALAVLTAAHHPLYDRHVQNVLAGNLHEDIFWSFLAPQLLDRFRIPSPREALLFAFETEPRLLLPREPSAVAVRLPWMAELRTRVLGAVPDEVAWPAASHAKECGWLWLVTMRSSPRIANRRRRRDS